MRVAYFKTLLILNSLIVAQIVDDNDYLQYLKIDLSANSLNKLSFYESKVNIKNIHFKYDFYNSIINYNQKFKDNNFLFVYSLADTIDSNMDFELSLFLENSKSEPVNHYSRYYNDQFNGFSGDIRKSYLIYQNNNFVFKIGRDYFLPGKYLQDRLLFSANGFPYDHFVFSFIKDKFSISSFYLKLNNFRENNLSYNRHLSGRRMILNLKNGYISLNEISVYGGEYQNINMSLLNPFNISYIYQMNNNFSLNSIISLEYLFQNKNYSVFIEFVLDDIQIEKNTSDDLEPTEFGFLLNYNKNINNFFNFNSSSVIISNRTFNAPVFEYEKLIYKNFPIGHILGNNFWKIENSIVYGIQNFSLSGSHIYIEKGNEALFSTFNTDFLNHSIDEGYQEEFPFGPKSIMSGFLIQFDWRKYKNVNFSTSISYWFNTYLDNEGINLSTSISYNYDF